MGKRAKHDARCMHCAFIKAFMNKYPTHKKRHGGKAFNDMAQSATKVAVVVMKNLDAEGQKAFMAGIVERATQVSTLETILAKVAEVAKGPTKH